MNGAEWIMKTARENGVDVCFANPGTTELPLVIALDTAGGFRSILGLFEGVCTGAADGYARMSGKPAMVLLHLGPGLANGIANLHNARRGYSPVLMVVGEHATWHRPYDPPLAMDIESLARTVSGWQHTCSLSDNLGQDVADAIFASRLGQVSTLIVPCDLQLKQCRQSAITPYHHRKTPVSPEVVESAAAVLKGGRKSALVLSGNVLRRDGLMIAARIRQACGCDLLTESFPAYIERGEGLPDICRMPYLPEMAIDLLSKYEVLVFAGAKEPVSFFGYEGVPATLLKEDQKKFRLARHDQDVMEALRFLADALDAPATPSEAMLSRQDRPAIPTGSLSADKICSVIAALQPEGAVVVEEAVTSGFMFYPLTVGVPQFSLLTLTGGSLGMGAPCAVGAAVACPDRQVIDIESDGAGMYTVQALWTQAKEGLDVTTLVCSNRSYDILKLELARLGVFSPAANTARLTDLGGIDWVSIGKGMGVPSQRADTAEGLAKDLERALREPGPHLIEMVM